MCNNRYQIINCDKIIRDNNWLASPVQCGLRHRSFLLRFGSLIHSLCLILLALAFRHHRASSHPMGCDVHILCILRLSSKRKKKGKKREKNRPLDDDQRLQRLRRVCLYPLGALVPPCKAPPPCYELLNTT